MLLMKKKCLRYPRLGLGLRRHVRRCASVVQPVLSGRHHRLFARLPTTRSAVHILTLSATDRFTAATLTADKNSSCGRAMSTRSVASRETTYRLLVMKLRSAVTGMFASRELMSPWRVHRPSHLVRVRPHRSQTVVLPILFQRHRHRHTTMSIQCFCRLEVDEPLGTRHCRRQYSRCRCHVESCRRRKSHTRDRRPRPELAAFTARNCSSCPRIAPVCVRTRRTTARHASSMRRVCAPRGPCCITARPTMTETTGRFVELGSLRRLAPGVRRSVGSAGSGCCLCCCRSCCHVSGAIPH